MPPPYSIPGATLLQDTQPGNPVSMVGQIGGILSSFGDECADGEGFMIEGKSIHFTLQE